MERVECCPVCGDAIDYPGVIWHLRRIHEYTTDMILTLLFQKLERLEGIIGQDSD